MKGCIHMKYSLSDLCIEVTRKCNMQCKHCLRGDAQSIDIDTQYIDRLLENIDSISCITFSGGEPSLNVQAIEYTLERCKELDIYVGSFYIVTNGKLPMLPLASACLKWYAYCEDKEYCGLALSKDVFHDAVNKDNEALLRGLSFFCEDKFTDFSQTRIINEGRAQELGGFYKVDVEDCASPLSIDEQYVETMIYLSVNGEIRTACDVAYENEDFTIGNIADDNLENIFQTAMVYA